MMPPEPPQRLPGWKVAALVTGLVAAGGLALGLLLADKALEGSFPPRTLPGAVLMVMGVAGLSVPLAFVFGRHRFVRLPRGRRWVVLGAAAGVHALAIVGLMLCAPYYAGPTIIPYPNVLVLQVSGDGKLECRVKPLSGSAYAFSHGGPGEFKFETLPYPRGTRKTTLIGVIAPGPDGGLEFRGTLTDTEEFRLRVEGPDRVRLTVDDQPQPGAVQLARGTYRIRLTGLTE